MLEDPAYCRTNVPTGFLSMKYGPFIFNKFNRCSNQYKSFGSEVTVPTYGPALSLLGPVIVMAILFQTMGHEQARAQESSLLSRGLSVGISPDSDAGSEIDLLALKRERLAFQEKIEKVQQEIAFKQVRMKSWRKLLGVTIPPAKFHAFEFSLEMEQFEAQSLSANLLVVEEEILLLQRLMEEAQKGNKTLTVSGTAANFIAVWTARLRAADIQLKAAEHERGYYESEHERIERLASRNQASQADLLTASENLGRAQLKKRQQERHREFVVSTLNELKDRADKPAVDPGSK